MPPTHEKHTCAVCGRSETTRRRDNPMGWQTFIVTVDCDHDQPAAASVMLCNRHPHDTATVLEDVLEACVRENGGEV